VVLNVIYLYTVFANLDNSAWLLLRYRDFVIIETSGGTCWIQDHTIVYLNSRLISLFCECLCLQPWTVP
jgi:hypothetical protein